MPSPCYPGLRHTDNDEQKGCALEPVIELAGRCIAICHKVRQGAGDRGRPEGIAVASAGEDRSRRHDHVFRTALGKRRRPDGVALNAPDERSPGRPIESGARRLAEEIT